MTKENKEIQLDFLKSDTNQTATQDIESNQIITKPKTRRGPIKGVIFIVSLLIFLGSLVLYIRISATPLGATLNDFSWLASFKHLFTNADRFNEIGHRDQVNILLLGMGGVGHEGAYLTDTIIVVSFKPATKQLAMISIPRDLYVDMGSYGWKKINSANAYGEMAKYPGGGAAFSSQIVSEVIGQPIDYFVRVDFNGFKKLINDLGGLEINIEQGFTDSQYPDNNFGYQALTFNKGKEQMSGERALQYARSRHGNNGQGSDFARSRRQMQILMAIKDKIMTASTLLNPIKLNDLYDNLTANITTNIKTFEALRFWQLGRNINQSNIIHKVLDSSADGLLYSYISETGAYVLSPRGNNYEQIHKLFDQLFNASEIQNEASTVVIYNGTNITGLAAETSQRLSQAGYQILLTGNAPSRDWTRTIAYDLRAEKNQNNSRSYLATTLDASIQTELPFELQEKLTNEPTLKNSQIAIDFVIVLGNQLAP